MKNRSPKQSQPSETCSNPDRREFLSTAAKGLGTAAVLSSLPMDWVGGVYAAEGPETSNLKFGIIALTDCSPIVIAHEKGFLVNRGQTEISIVFFGLLPRSPGLAGTYLSVQCRLNLVFKAFRSQRQPF